MRREQIERWRLLAKMPGHRAKVAHAMMRVKEWLGRCKKPYISFSGGKDSIVCLHIARSIDQGAIAIHSHDEWILPETDEYMRTVDNLVQIAGPHTHLGGWRTWLGGADSCPDHITWVGGNSHPLERYVKTQGYDGVAIGLRCDEAGYRARHIRGKGALFQRVDGVHQCYPIAGWSSNDVWAYIHSNAIPYNAAYDRMSALGFPEREWRVGPWANDMATAYGSISNLKRGWPDIYQRFICAYPEWSKYA